MHLPPLPQALDLWMPTWLRQKPDALHPLGSRHLMICVCDHFEPPIGAGQTDQTLRTLDRWRSGLGEWAEEFRDSGGAAPRHTFFCPAEWEEREVVRHLSAIAHATSSEVEVLLHPGCSSLEKARRDLENARERLALDGLLSRDEAGQLRYGCVRESCGRGLASPETPLTAGELVEVLRETGCYGDFTLPTAPRRTQTRTINRLYYTRKEAGAQAFEGGRSVRATREGKPAGHDELLVVQGPVAPDWARSRWGIIPGLENGELTAANPPTRARLELWMNCRIAVLGRPNWLFAKLHTHGAADENREMLLGEPMRAFHRALAREAQRDPQFRYHYVSARELANILHAAEFGHSGDPAQFRDYCYRLAVAVPQV